MTQQTLYKIPSVHKNDKTLYDGGKKDDGGKKNEKCPKCGKKPCKCKEIAE
jgi:hypothetical protein